MILSHSASDPITFHVYCCGFFPVPLVIMFAVVLSIATSVGGCWRPISDWELHMDVVFWKFSNNPTNYASVSDSMKFPIMLHSTCTGPFSGVISCIGLLDFGPRKKYPPDLPRASVS